MRLPKPAFCAAAFLAGSFAVAQTDVRIDEIYVCGRTGTTAAAKVGEPFWVGAQFTVLGHPSSRYKFRVETPFARIETARLSFGLEPGEYRVYAGPIPALMDGPIEVKATLDPERRLREFNRIDNFSRFVVEPEPPITAHEYFHALSLQSRLTTTIAFYPSSNVPSNLTAWIPIAANESFQENTLPTNNFLSIAAAEPFGQSIGINIAQPTNRDPFTFEAGFQTTARASRINFDLLTLLGRGVDPEQSRWLLPEKLVEVGKPEFHSWLASVFPNGYQIHSTAEIAEKIYRCLLRRTIYALRPGIAPSALRTLRDKKGDCGGLSALFVALCRTAGIPARTVAGFTTGANNWHVWAEFHVSGAGWIPVDPAYAEARLHTGADLPIYFGVIPDLNERVATAFGFDRRLSGREVSMLQSPVVFWVGNGLQVKSVTPVCQLNVQ